MQEVRIRDGKRRVDRKSLVPRSGPEFRTLADLPPVIARVGSRAAVPGPQVRGGTRIQVWIGPRDRGHPPIAPRTLAGRPAKLDQPDTPTPILGANYFFSLAYGYGCAVKSSKQRSSLQNRPVKGVMPTFCLCQQLLAGRRHENNSPGR